MNQTKQIAVLCLSGGMDSTSLLLHMLARNFQVFAISFDYGQKHRLELERLATNLQYLCQHGLQVAHTVIDLSQLGQLFHSALTTGNWQVPEGFYEQENMKQTVVPNRNAIFSSISYGYALSIANQQETSVQLGLGVHSGDHAIYPDCRQEFYDALYRAFELGNWDAERVQLYLPFLDGDKFTILEDAQESIDALELDFNTVFRNTCTSYDPDEAGRSSGKTGSDVERILAFHQLGIPDPIEYQQSWDVVVQQALQYQANAKSN